MFQTDFYQKKSNLKCLLQLTKITVQLLNRTLIQLISVSVGYVKKIVDARGVETSFPAVKFLLAVIILDQDHSLNPILK